MKSTRFLRLFVRPIAILCFLSRKLCESVRTFGVIGTLVRVLTLVQNGKLRAIVATRKVSLLSTINDANKNILSTFYPTEDSHRQAATLLVPRVLIVAEMSIPQCRKYRVIQKAELFKLIDVETTTVDWTHFEEVRTLLQTHSLVIFYRVPAVPEVLLILKEAKRLGIRTLWEVDDLVFDPAGYLTNNNLNSINAGERKGLLAGMKLYREALLLCDESIGSTQALAKVMTETNGRKCYVVENALDQETIELAYQIRKSRDGRVEVPDKMITIVYGSGTKTHDIDFLSASEAIFSVLSKRTNVKLRIIGELNIDKKFDIFSSRIERAPFSTFAQYLRMIAEADIAIAPLERTIFNDAKSNIKYLEASILGIPSICSPADAFRTAIVDGENGYLAIDTEEWEQKLIALVDSADLRLSMGTYAFDSVVQAYSTHRIAKEQLSAILADSANQKIGVTRILLANIYFAPQSFGGATIVAEELAQRLAQYDNVEVYVFTSWSYSTAPDYSVVRYSAKGATVFAVKVPTIRTRLMDVKDDAMTDIFMDVLRAVKPDVVQLHSIQTLGVTLGSACKAAGIPYAITLHDAWWLCERQFMVTGENKYCFQTSIDQEVCARCVPDRSFNESRTAIARTALAQADGLISPSVYFKNLHRQNGLPEERIFVNKNGVKTPTVTYKRTPSDRVRFGYVGGSTPIKGYELVREAFSKLPQCDIELIMVDNTLNQGYSSVNTRGMNGLNPVRIVPAYSQDNIDEFFSEIDVLLFPSQWKESFGLTVREALIRDVWVIASDSGGAIEDIVPGENGDIIPISNDSIYLRKAMEKVASNKELLRNYKNPHKSRIQDFDGQAEELLTHLLELAKSHSRDS